MATSLDYSMVLSEVTLDLDDISNIGHPCWELLDPNPNIIKLFNEYNHLLFDGILENRVENRWLEEKFATDENKSTAGETLKSYIYGRMVISLNSKLLRKRTRRDTIEILIHEMIHAYLIQTGNEDQTNHFHGVNFVKKMSEINALTGLNITIYNDFLEDGEEKHYKWYCWRCIGECRYKAPYFGFIWINEPREPSSTDLMWTDSEKCAHQFEKYGDNPKEWITLWECIIMFNEFVAQNNIHIKTKKFQSLDANSNRITANDSFVLEISTDGMNPTTDSSSARIANELYVNYDRELKKFINVDNYLKVDIANCVIEDSQTVCMICLGKIDDDNVIEHLNKCTGVEFSLNSGDSLPIFKID